MAEILDPQITDSTIKNQLLATPALQTHPQASRLIEIMTGETNMSSAGFPYLSDRSFRFFIEHIPHLFNKGNAILAWLQTFAATVDKDLPVLPSETRQSIERAIKVVRTIIYTAGITAPPDLWLLKQVLGVHKELGTINWLLSGHAVDPEVYAERSGLSLKQLSSDLHFLYSRGYLRRGDGNFLAPSDPKIRCILESIAPLTAQDTHNFVSISTRCFKKEALPDAQKAILKEWLQIDCPDEPTHTWIANTFEIEIGYRILPLVLALRVCGLTEKLVEGYTIEREIPDGFPEIHELFRRGGLTRRGSITALGHRVFQRGPGPFGIIGTYHTYMAHLKDILQSRKLKAWVQRGENVAASQDANRKTFEMGNDALDAFCNKYEYAYTVFIEHAVGHGEATRQRFERSGEDTITYFGADLEDDAIDQAIVQQKQGYLPQNMQFIRSADIGKPKIVTQFLAEKQMDGQNTVMIVGNGFHEIREQTNEKMLTTFKEYEAAGFILIFTEESALHDEALIHTAWNTYHAGFRYVHELSGQGLRPAIEDKERISKIWSWRKAATRAGYVILDEFSYRSRTIYPHKRPEHKNPSISVTYFCVPASLAAAMGIEPPPEYNA